MDPLEESFTPLLLGMLLLSVAVVVTPFLLFYPVIAWLIVVLT